MDKNIAHRRWSRWRWAPAGVLLLCLLDLVAAMPAQAKIEPAESRAYYESALKHIEKNELRAAVIELKNALQRDPQNADARLLLGRVYVRLGEGAAAEKELDAAERYGVAAQRLAVPRGRALLLQGRLEELLAALDPADYEPELEREISLLRAEAEAGLGRLAEARGSYESIAERYPEEGRAELGLARLDLAARHYETADKHAADALAQDPALVEAMLVQAEARRLQGNAESALSLYRRVIDEDAGLSGRGVRARLGLATALLALQRDEEAGAELQEMQVLGAEVPLASYLRALIEIRAGGLEAARRTLEASAPSLEAFVPAQFLFGVTYFAADELETARSWLARHLAAQPQNLQARKILGATLLRLNAVAEAVGVLEAGRLQMPDDPQILMMLGNAYVRSGRSAEASEVLQQAAELAPQDPRVLNQLVISHLAEGDYDRSLAALSASLDLDAGGSTLGYALAFMHLRDGDFDEALKVAQELRRRFPESALAANLEGGAYAALSRLEEARKSFEAALQAEPDFHQARTNLAALKAQAGDLDGAATEYRTVLASDAGNAKALMGLAAVAASRGEDAESRAWLEKAIETNPEEPQPSLALAESYAAAGEFADAEKVLTALLRRQRDNLPALSLLGKLQAQDGRSEQAVATFQHLVDASDGSVQAHLLLAQARLGAGDGEGARRELEDALAADPDHLPTVEALFRLVPQLEGPEETLAYAERLQRRYPEAAWGYRVIGDLHLRAGRRDAAIAAYEKGWREQPSAGVAIALSRARLARGDGDVALAPLEAWLERQPDDVRVRMALAESLLGLGALDRAREAYETIVKSQSNNPVVWNNLAWLYQQAGDERAVAYGERALDLAPDHPAILDTFGWILLDAGEVSRAADLLRQASLAAPDNPEIAYHYAVAQHRNGDDVAARKTLEALLRSEADFAGRKDAAVLLRELAR